MNLNPQETIEHLQALGRELSSANEELVRLSNECAEAENNYNIAVTKKVVSLEMEGAKATLIPHLIKGSEEVAPLLRQYSLLKGLVDAQKRKLSSLHDRISIGQSSLNWLKVEYNSGGNQ